jgi:hypothetical protein
MIFEHIPRDGPSGVRARIAINGTAGETAGRSAGLRETVWKRRASGAGTMRMRQARKHSRAVHAPSVHRLCCKPGARWTRYIAPRSGLRRVFMQTLRSRPPTSAPRISFFSRRAGLR